MLKSQKIPVPYKHPAVCGLVFNEDQSEILITKRNDIPIWVLPGGGIDEGESPDDAIIREIKEETGLIVTVKRKVGEYHPINRLSFFTHLFECKKISGNLTLSNETCDVAFVSIHSLPKAFFYLHADWIQDALHNHKHVLQNPIHQINYFQLCYHIIRYPYRSARALISRITI